MSRDAEDLNPCMRIGIGMNHSGDFLPTKLGNNYNSCWSTVGRLRVVGARIAARLDADADGARGMANK